jgi:gamma-glutamyltranspeptidase
MIPSPPPPGGFYPVPGHDDISPFSAFTPFPSRRSVVHSTKGIVSTTNPLATQAGLRILEQGGNAAVCFH